MHGNRLSRRGLRRGSRRLERGEALGKLLAIAEHGLSFLNQIPAAADAELGEQRRNVEFHGANGNAQAIGNFLVHTVVQQFLEDFSFAGTEVNRTGKRSACVKKFIGVFLDAFDEGVFGGNPDGVIGGRISTSHATQRQQTCGAAEGRFIVAVHFHLKAQRSGTFLAEDERSGTLHRVCFFDFFVSKKLLELLGFSKNSSTPCLSYEQGTGWGNASQKSKSFPKE
jgi:hypothetical protein